MNTTNEISFDHLLEVLAEKLATKLAQEPSRLLPRLMTVDQVAVYLGWTSDAVQELLRSGKVPTVRREGYDLVDRLDIDRWIDAQKTRGV